MNPELYVPVPHSPADSMTFVLGCFAVLALVLAAAAIYGAMAHLVSLRTPEIGIRLTLGARPMGG